MADHQPADRGAVVITGTSTGIGAATAMHLADVGFSVFAGVRRLEDGEALRKRTSHQLVPLLIDITDAAHHRRGGRDGCATPSVIAASPGSSITPGSSSPGPLEFQPMADFREQFEVEPLRRRSPLPRRSCRSSAGAMGGSSTSARSADGWFFPLHGAYSASKFAMEAISDALRLELRQW